mgnify:CR=1 FL=1
MTQNPNATQFQEVWAGMTQWADIAGRNTRFSAQTTRFFCAAEPAELLPYLVQLLGEEKVQSNVYALTPNGAKEQHLLDINNLIEGFSQLTQEQNWKAAHDASAADDSARDSLDADDDESINVEKFPLSAIPRLIRVGEIEDAKTIAALLMVIFLFEDA